MRYSSRNIWLLTGLGLMAIVVAHLLPHAIRMGDAWVAAIVFGLLMALGCALFASSHFAMDDIQRQNQKTDTYWGSMIGIGLLGGLVLPYVMFGGGLENLVSAVHWHQSPKGYFFAGVTVTLILFLLGWVLAFLFRRLRWMKS